MYDDGRHAQFETGGHEDFFNLLDCKIELGKDFKRITLYLCTLSDHRREIPETSKTKQFDLEPNWFDFEPVQNETVERNPVDGCDESFS